MQPRFEQFIRERKYLSNVTPSTVDGTRIASNGCLPKSPRQKNERRRNPDA